MGYINYIWRKITTTQALEGTSRYERAFFESVYRIVYAAGLSASDGGLLYLAYSVTIKFLIAVLFLIEVWCLFEATKLDKIIENLNVTLIHVISIYKYLMLRKDKGIYKKLANATESPYFDTFSKQRKMIVENWIANNERYFKVLLALGNCALAAWYIFPFLDDVDYNFIIAVKIPFTYTTPFRYGLTYLFISVIFYYLSHFVMVNDLIMQAFLVHLLCQFDVLRDCFENILIDCGDCFKDSGERIQIATAHKNEAFVQKYLERLGNLVKQHEFLLSNTSQLRRILSMPMLAQVASSLILICFAAYQVTESMSAGITKLLMCLFYLGYNLFQLFIFCKWCDEIKVQSENIGEAIYFSGWEHMAMVPGVRARIVIVTTRASRPMVMTAGELSDMSLRSYANLIKTSYSALSVLLRTSTK